MEYGNDVDADDDDTDDDGDGDDDPKCSEVSWTVWSRAG